MEYVYFIKFQLTQSKFVSLLSSPLFSLRSIYFLEYASPLLLKGRMCSPSGLQKMITYVLVIDKSIIWLMEESLFVDHSFLNPSVDET